MFGSRRAMRVASALVVAVGVFAPMPAFSAGIAYQIDATHTVAQFSIVELGLWRQDGRFARTRGAIVYDPQAPSGSIDFTVDVASVETGWDARDDFVRGEHMLDARHYPVLRFRSTAMRFDGHRLVAVDGLLTLRDVTRPVRFDVRHLRCGDSPSDDGDRCDAAISGTISRLAFGLDFAYPIVGDEIEFDFDVAAFRGVTPETEAAR